MRLRLLSALTAAIAIAACNNDSLLPLPTDTNRQDTIVLGALRSSSIETPSAYSVINRAAVRTDAPFGASFDFLYDIDPVKGPAFYPAEVAGVVPKASTNPGLKRMSVPFDSIKIADLNGYVNDSIVPIDSGDVFLVRSGVACGSGLSLYGKIEVTKIDTAAHAVTFLAVMDITCGYRGLELGYPKH